MAEELRSRILVSNAFINKILNVCTEDRAHSFKSLKL